MSHTTERFDLQTRIAIGNAGLVYRATDKATRQKVALKLLLGEDLAHPLNGEKLVRDAAELRRIAGNNIAQLLEIIEDEAGVVLVYELADGPSWLQAAAQRRLDPAEALDVSAQLLSALAIGESLGRPHGEIKPSNLVLSRLPEGRSFVWVLDWGLSAYRPEPPPDALLFLAPEQLEGRANSSQGDLFAAGASLFYLLTGRAPVAGHHRAEVSAAWKKFSPTVLRKLRPDLPPKFLRWLASLLEVNPRKRPGTVRQALRTLAELKPPSPPVLPEIFRPRAKLAAPQVPTPVAPTAIAAAAQIVAIPRVVAAPATRQALTEPPAEDPLPQSELPASEAMGQLTGRRPGRDRPPAPLPAPPARTGKSWGAAAAAALVALGAAGLFLNRDRGSGLAKPGSVPAAAVPPGLLATDAFDYSASAPLGGQKGGVGWTGPWLAQRTTIGRGSLVTGLAEAGATGGHAALAASEESALKRPLGAPALFFDQTKGGTWWFSLLIAHTGGPAGNGGELQLNVFGTDRINDIIRLTLLEKGNRLLLRGPKAKAITLPGSSSETKHLVGRIQAKPAAAGKFAVTLELWVNPTAISFANSPPKPDLIEAVRDVKFPARLGVVIQKKSSANPTTTLVDELRFSRTRAELFK